MHRNATVEDYNFIYELIMDGSKVGNFTKEYYEVPEAANGLKVELMSILTTKTRHKNRIAYAIIYEYKNKPIGFVIISSIDGRDGNELYMASISPEYRGKGFGKKMIKGITEQFEGKNLAFLARCNLNSEGMYQILLKSGFEHMDTGEEGYRVLSFTL